MTDPNQPQIADECNYCRDNSLGLTVCNHPKASPPGRPMHRDRKCVVCPLEVEATPEQPLELNRFQWQVGCWAEATFPDSTPQSIMAHLWDKVRELDQIRERTDSLLGEEIADCVLLLIHLAYKKRISLSEVLLKKHEKNKRRKWETEPNEKRNFHHVQED